MSAYAHDPRVAAVGKGFDDVEYRITPTDGALPNWVYSKNDGDTWTSVSAFPRTFATADEAIADLIGPPAGGA